MVSHRRCQPRYILFVIVILNVMAIFIGHQVLMQRSSNHRNDVHLHGQFSHSRLVFQENTAALERTLIEKRLSQLNHSGFQSDFWIRMRDEEKTVIKEGWETNTDPLLKACRERDYGDLDGWPTASVIIAYCEAERMPDVLRTVHSIFQRTPAVLLREIILVDDATSKDEFRETFQIYLSAVFGGKVKVARSESPLGLIRARLYGSRVATGDVIVVMDAHMEVQDTWLEAMLYEIRKDKKTLATAALDWLMQDQDTGIWTYRTGFSSFICAFGWEMSFGFEYSRPEFDQAWHRNNTMAIPAPCTVGGIYGIDLDFFREIGELDEGMEKWGGENLDIAIRTWLFGGRAVQVPCSHVAHIERIGQRNYRAGWERSVDRNLRRVVDVWFDDYKKYVLIENPNIKTVDPGNLTERLELKQRALHDFEWYLDNVFPELGIFDRKSAAHGMLVLAGTWLKTCANRVGGEALKLETCIDDKNRQVFLSEDGYIRIDLRTWHAKTQIPGALIDSEGAMGTYHMPWLSQWVHWKDGPMMLYIQDGGKRTSLNLCMEGFNNGTISLQPCDSKNIQQRWHWQFYTDIYHNNLNGQSSDPLWTEVRRIKASWGE